MAMKTKLSPEKAECSSCETEIISSQGTVRLVTAEAVDRYRYSTPGKYASEQFLVRRSCSLEGTPESGATQGRRVLNRALELFRYSLDSLHLCLIPSSSLSPIN